MTRLKKASYTLCIKLLILFRRLEQTRIIEVILPSLVKKKKPLVNSDNEGWEEYKR